MELEPLARPLYLCRILIRTLITWPNVRTCQRYAYLLALSYIPLSATVRHVCYVFRLSRNCLCLFLSDTTKIRLLFVPTKYISKKIGIKRTFNIRTQNKRNRNTKEKKAIRIGCINESKVK